jgi:hypothetical protein
VAILPGLIDFGDGFNGHASNEGWHVDVSHNPLISIGKVVVGGTINYLATDSINKSFKQTEQAITSTYRDINTNNTPDNLTTNVALFSVLIAVFVTVVYSTFTHKKQP